MIMKILLVTSDFPYEGIKHGGGTLSLGWVRHLARSHELWLLSFLREEEEEHLSSTAAYFQEVRTVPARRGWFSRLGRLPLLFSRPYPEVATYSRRMKRELRGLLERVDFDLVQFEYSHMGQYLELVPPSLPRGIIFIDLVTAVLSRWVQITGGYKKYYYRRQERLTRRREEGYAVAATGALTLSEKDKKILESWRPGIKARVLPLLLEGELYSAPEGESEAGNILFIGAMHRPVNIDAALLLKKRILPLLERSYPDYRCYIVGHNPPSSLKRLSTDRFIVTGSVPRIEPYLDRAAVVVVPLRVAGGVIVKILQALAAGRPVVATTAANAGIGAEDGKEILLADRPENIADRLRELLEDPLRGREIGRAGQKFFRGKFNLETCRKKLDSIYRELMEQKDETAD